MIKVIADTTCGLPINELESLNIDVIPQIIIFDDEQYRDDNEIDTDTFLAKLKEASSLPKTAAPSPALYEPLFREYAQKGISVIIPTPSSEVSGTYRSAEVAAEMVPEADVHIIDTRTIAGGLGVLVKKAQEWANAGFKPEEIVQKIEDLSKKEVVYFLVDTLKYLHMGGRIGNASYLVGSILQVKPILGLNDGKIEVVEKTRTFSKAFARIKELTLEQCPPGEESYLTISHCDGHGNAERMARELSDALNIESIPLYQVPPAIVVHGGPGIVSVSFFKA